MCLESVNIPYALLDRRKKPLFIQYIKIQKPTSPTRLHQGLDKRRLIFPIRIPVKISPIVTSRMGLVSDNAVVNVIFANHYISYVDGIEG